MSENTNAVTDLAKLADWEEEITANPEANPFIPPTQPPVPEDTYVCRITFAKPGEGKTRWNTGQKTAEGKTKKWLHTALQVEIIKGEYNTRKTRDGYVSTMLMKNGASKVMGVTKALGGKTVASDTNKGITHKDQAMCLEKVIGDSGAIGQVSLLWEATFYCKIGDTTINITKDMIKSGGSDRITGCTSSEWPKDDAGNPLTSFNKDMVIEIEVEDDEGDGESSMKEFKVKAIASVRNIVVDYKPAN